MIPDSLPVISGPPAVDSLAVRCGYCRAPKGSGCQTSWFRPCRPHKARTDLARLVASHADPVLDEFPELGPVTGCGICGTPGLPQRHRMVDAIAGRVAAGEDEEDVAADYHLPVAAVLVVTDWDRRWGQP